MTGQYEETTAGGESVRAFVPYPLPPKDPPLQLNDKNQTLIADAELAVARLNLAKELVPSVDWFVYAFTRKEAVLSSRIEGVEATLEDLLTFEATDGSSDLPRDTQVKEVCNYLDALAYAQDEMRRPGGLPVSIRLLDEAHKRLLKGARGASKQPGEVRRSQNWIGGTRPGNAVYVPPPPHVLPGLLSDLERYVHAEDESSPLVRAALVHVQFETIHPYLDGNGRLGRLLIALLLEHWNVLGSPLLFLSLHFMRHRAEYYRLLNAVRTEGDWESWVGFFLEGVGRIANEAVSMARDLFDLVSKDRTRVLNFPSSSLMTVKLLEQLPRHPVVTVAGVTQLLKTSKPTAIKAVQTLVDAGILVETTGRKRDRLFGYTAYLERLKGEAGEESVSQPAA
jgi:Fic family protein